MKRLIACCTLSLIVVGGVASAVAARAQSERQSDLEKLAQRVRDSRVISGDDLGFRVEGVDSKGMPRGRIVVRVNGEWLDTGEEAVARLVPVR